MKGYIALTHDLRQPGSMRKPLWDGSVPFDLQTPDADIVGGGTTWRNRSGLFLWPDGHAALLNSGLWSDGRPSRLYRVEAESATKCGDRYSARTIKVVDEVCDIRPHVERMAAELFDDRYCTQMVGEQLAWHAALRRAKHNAAVVDAGLKSALMARGLSGWTLRRYDNANAAVEAHDALGVHTTDIAFRTWNTEAVSFCDGGRSSTQDCDTFGAYDADVALIVMRKSFMGDVSFRGDLLTVGIRDAYAAGLHVAIPTGPAELGWSMDD